MARVFNIEIAFDYGWEIDIVGLVGSYDNYQSVTYAPIIGVCKMENDKLVAMYDPFPPSDEIITHANEYDIFKEECEFNHLEHSFSGTFIDAMIYIQKQYQEVADE